MKKNRKNIFIIFILMFGNAYAQQSATTLYVSTQNGQSSVYSGSYSKSTDRYENGTVNISKTGPVIYTINPPDLSISPNETKSWTGTVKADPSTSPAPGNSASANITANYTIGYSRPYGTGTNGTVQSTYYCTSSTSSGGGSSSGSGSTGGCPYHGTTAGVHEIVSVSGVQTLSFTVISILADLPDTLCLGASGSGQVNVTTFPLAGGTYSWVALSSAVTIANADQKDPTVTLTDTSVHNARIKVTFTIGGVSYSDVAVVSTCDCSCRPITGGITVGPVHLTFNAPPQSTLPDGSGDCKYVANDAGVAIKMDGSISRQAQVDHNVHVAFSRNCKTSVLGNVSIDWVAAAGGEIPMPDIAVNGVNILKIKLKEFHLQVATNGNLSGTVKINAMIPIDIDLSPNTGFVMLRKGLNSDITFSFSNQSNWNGTFDFSGLQGIKIDLVKKNGNADVIIAKFSGNMDNQGSLTGQLQVVGGAAYKTSLFKVTMGTLALGVELKIPQASFRLTDGSGSVTVSDMTGVTGTITLGLVFPPAGGCMASISASNITAFSMTLNQLNLQVNFDKNFDMSKFTGSLKAKHNLFSVDIDVSNFIVENSSLTTFTASGNVKYSAFKFSLLNSNYVNNPRSLSFDAKVELDATGTSAQFQVTGFKIADNGTITVGAIAGSFDKGPASFAFSATFGNSRFRGTFNGNFATIGLDGNIDVGSMQSPDYNFAYFAIAVHTDIPLGQSGLKLTTVGGQAGFNYALQFPGGVGNPQQSNYVIGLTLGVADVSNMCQVTGNTVIQINSSSGNVVITLNGSIAVLRTNQFFQGNVNVNYRIPQQTIDGQVGAVVKVPSSGFILTTQNVNVRFNFGGGSWSANGTNMGGKMFNGIVQLSNGTINMNGSTSSPTQLTGSIGGTATAQFDQSVNVSAGGNSITGNIVINMNSDINANIDQNGLSGSFAVHVDGTGTITVDTWIYTDTIQANAVADGQIGYSGSTLSLSGNMTVTLPFSIPFWGNSFNAGLNVSL